MSSSVYEQARRKGTIQFVDLGERSLKNIPDPIRAYKVAMDSSVRNAPNATTGSLSPGEEPLVGSPFDIGALKKIKNIEQYCLWDITMEAHSLTGISVAELFRRLQANTKVSAYGSGHKEYTPAILDPKNKKTNAPQMVFDSGDRSSIRNILECDHLRLSQSCLRYSFIYFHHNQPNFHPIDFAHAEQTLVQLLVLLMKVHLEVAKTPDISVRSRIYSSFNAEYLPSNRPFKVSQNFMEWHIHPVGETSTEYTLRRLDAEEAERFLNSILEMFVSKSGSSDKPFLAADHTSFALFWLTTTRLFA